MPYISVNLSSALSSEKEEILKKEFGELIQTIPGKTEERLMLEFQDNCRLWFKGQNNAPIAFINVMLYGKSEHEFYQALADKTIALLNRELDVPSANIYVKFEEVPNWFWG